MKHGEVLGVLLQDLAKWRLQQAACQWNSSCSADATRLGLCCNFQVCTSPRLRLAAMVPAVQVSQPTCHRAARHVANESVESKAPTPRVETIGAAVPQNGSAVEDPKDFLCKRPCKKLLRQRSAGCASLRHPQCHHQKVFVHGHKLRELL